MASDTSLVLATHVERAIPALDVLALYRQAGWWPERTHEQVSAVLNAGPALGAWLGAELVGFARAVTDGVLRAYVEDVIVARKVRHTGIGRALIERLVQELPPTLVVTLFCGDDLVPFYTASGFRETAQTVMHRR